MFKLAKNIKKLHLENIGTIEGAKDVKTGKDILIKMSRFDRLVG